MVRLVISDHEGSTTVVPLLRDEVTIGRKEGNTIRLTERNISRRHVQLLRVGGVYNLRDLDSYNGVLVNGRKVEGETVLNNGDQIQLGDYTILVEEDASARDVNMRDARDANAREPRDANAREPRDVSVSVRSAAPAEAHPPASRRPVVPARLVMLTQPASGAEFVLPLDRSARLGRSDEVDCPINHRSVSREHASIRRDGDVFVIEDMGSSNGVTVNKRPVKSAELRSGDIIELGQVVFRFVAAGEHYFFDPAEAARYRSARVGKNAATLRLAALLGAVTLAALVFLLLPTPEVPPPPTDAEVSSNTHFPGEGDQPPAANDEPPVVPPVTAPNDDGYDTAVLACRSALAATRFAEAAAQAQLALKLRPTASEALDCKQRADDQASEEQQYFRGKDALARGEVELAYLEFFRLPEHSAFRDRSEVALATSELVRLRLNDARAALPGNRAEAARLAQSVLGLRGISQEQASAAEQVLAEARGGKAQAPQTSVAQAPRAPRPAPAAAPARSTLLAPNQTTDVQRSPSRVNTNTAAASGAKPLDIANACLARGDNECVVQALEGSASSPQELALLIETYRTMGNVRQAQKHMNSFVQRYPTERRSDGYRRMLELQRQ